MKPMQMLTSEKGKKLVLLTFGALIIVGGVTWYYDYNQWTIHQKYQAKIDALKKDITEARRLALTLSQTAATRVKMHQFVEAHEATMVSGDQFAWVIREISHLAESQPVGNVSTQPGNIVQHARKANRQWYVTHLEFVGDYDQIGTFVRELENHFPEAEIRAITIVGTETPAIHRAALDLALLMRPAEAAGSALLAQKIESHHEASN